MAPGIGFKSTTAVALSGAVLAAAACGGDSKAPEAPAAQPPGVPSGGPMARPGSAGDAVLDFWRLLKVGAIPSAILAYEPSVRRTIGSAPMAGALQAASAQVSPLRPRIAAVDKTPNGTVVTVRAAGPSTARLLYGYVLVKRGKRWLLVYDTLVEQQLRAYVTQQAQARYDPKATSNSPPTSGASAAGSRIAAAFAAGALRKNRAKKPAAAAPPSGTPPAETPPAATPPAATPPADATP